LGSLSVNGAITHLSPLLTDRGISQQHAAYVASALGFFSFAGRLVTGALLDRALSRVAEVSVRSGGLATSRRRPR